GPPSTINIKRGSVVLSAHMPAIAWPKTARVRTVGNLRGCSYISSVRPGQLTGPAAPMTGRLLVTLLVKVAVKEDFYALLAMKSDPEAIKWSGFCTAPDPENREWFEKMLSDANRRVFIGFIDEEPIAYVQFKWEDDTERFGISYGVAKNHRGHG